MPPLNLTKSIDYPALKGRNVVITGGASGLGKAFVYMFAEAGANILIADVQDAAGQEIEKTLSGASAGVIKYLHVDVTAFESQVAMVQEAVALFPSGEIDIFIPCAGIANDRNIIAPEDPANLANLKSPGLDMQGKVIAVNLTGVFIGTMLVTRYGMGLHKPESGNRRPTKAVILIASIAGYSGGPPAEYVASKFGVRGLLRGLRKQLAGLGVRLNAIAPFYVETPLTAQTIPAFKQQGIPIATSAAVTEAVARLSTDEEAYGRSILVMPEGLSDAGDDSEGGQGGKSFSTEALGEQWAVMINGPMSDEVPA